MKQTLLLLESLLLRDYLRQKLEENGVEVYSAANPMDAITKMRNLAPDLIILDFMQDSDSFFEILKEKKLGQNTANTPVIVLAQKIEQKQLLELARFNVKKVFNKPIKIDAFFAALSELLGFQFKIDDKPGIIEVHVNENIIFIEIAKGLNRDKLGLLHFKITELIELYKIKVPKVIIILSDLKLEVADVPVFAKLLNTVLDTAKARQSNVRILTNDDFVFQFIETRKEYNGIIAASNLHNAMDGFLSDAGVGKTKEKAEFIGDIIQKSKTTEDDAAMALKFDSEEKKLSMELIRDSVQNLRIAVIDDDDVIQELIKNTFLETGAFVYSFYDGDEFLEVLDKEEFDLAFLDLNMPRVNGFEVLKAIQARDIRYPIIVLSAISQRDAMLKAIQMGIKSYLIKPLKPEDIFMKSIEILKANF
jgi:DNA-binding response OmpR family regulator